MSLLLLAPAFAAPVLFDIDGVLVKGDTISIAPAGGAGQVTEIVQVSQRIDGLVHAHIGETAVLDARDGDLGDLTLVGEEGTKVSVTDDGLDLNGDGLSWSARLPAGTAYVGLGTGCDDCRSDFVFGTTSYRTASDFVFGTTSYRQQAGEFVFGTTAYFRTADGDIDPIRSGMGGQSGRRLISADFGVDQCIAAVWDQDGLLYRAEVACEAIATVSDPGGDPFREIPKDQHITYAWSNEHQANVMTVIWTWAGGGIDVTHHMPGAAWID